MDTPKNQLAAKLKDANNVLVTVSANPSVDQLAAAIGLTLFLTKLKKHATTVFSGQVPSTIDFLQPEDTIETNTDSLRDFIISLDKAKADKIRYKVEDAMVKIFITPYRTSIGEPDLVFSQGDFNVDVVIGLGIHNREDIDQAIMAHGRILHDATVATVNTKTGSELGTLNWADPQASSLCEMAVALTDLLKANSLDGQMATAFLTGIVAETERFSNEKTSSVTMNASAKLMAAGANQQLVATKLETLPPEPDEPPAAPEPPQGGGGGGQQTPDAQLEDDGSLRIEHANNDQQAPLPPVDESRPPDTLPPPADDYTPPEQPKPVDQIKIDDKGELHVQEPVLTAEDRHFLAEPPVAANDGGMFGLPKDEEEKPERHPGDELGSGKMDEPKFGGRLSAAGDDSSEDKSAFDLPPVQTPMMNHDNGQPKDAQPEPYDVFEPQPGGNTPPPIPAPWQPPNLSKAAQQASQSLPSHRPPSTSNTDADDWLPKPDNTGQPFVDYDNKTLDSIEDKMGTQRADEHSRPEPKLPPSFAKSLDGNKLDELEKKVGSPHAKQSEEDIHRLATEQVAKAMSDKTLNEIEEKVDSPHLEQKAPEVEEEKPEEDDEPFKPAVLKPEPPKKDEGMPDYEPIGSEPPDPEADESDDEDESGDVESAAPDTPKADAPTSDDDNADDSKSDDDKAEESEKEEVKSEESEAKPEETADESAARDAVLQAVNAAEPPKLEPRTDLGTSGRMEVGHEEADGKPPATPPPFPVPQTPQAPSPHINIDDQGNLQALPSNLMPNSTELPKDETDNNGDESSAPPVPPPMMPPAA